MWETIKGAIQIALMLLGLTGLVDNIVVWHGFLANIIAEYQYIRDFIFDFVPFSMPYWLKDYLIIGAAFSSSFITVVFRNSDLTGMLNFLILFPVFAFHLIFWSLIWPFVGILMLGVLIANTFRGADPDYKVDEQILIDARFFSKRIFWTMVVFLGALFLASDALSKLGFG